MSELNLGQWNSRGVKMSDQPVFYITLLDRISINGKMSKKLFKKIIEPMVDRLEAENKQLIIILETCLVDLESMQKYIASRKRKFNRSDENMCFYGHVVCKDLEEKLAKIKEAK